MIVWKNSLRGLVLVAAATLWTCWAPLIQASDAAQDSPTYDLLIRNADIIDGTGSASQRGDIGIRDGRIVHAGPAAPGTAKRTIDAKGLIVAPGFIDMHSHAEEGLVSTDAKRRTAPNLVTQGITTVVVNQDGFGVESIGKQRQLMERLGVGPNVIQMVGHGKVRQMVMKDDHRRTATQAEVEAMCQLVDTGMKEGAFGLSAGLEYVPGRWSSPQEMTELVRVVVPYGGVYMLHERSSGSQPMWFLPSRDDPAQPTMIDNLNELINIAAETKATVVATHIKARGVDFWGSSQRMIGMIENARQRGIRIYADQYPYNTSGTDGRIVLIPNWLDERVESALQASKGSRPELATPADLLEIALADETIAPDLRRDIEFEINRRGGGDSIFIVEHKDTNLVGKTLAQFAQQLDCQWVDAVIQLQLTGDRSRRGGCRLRAFSMSEEDVKTFAAIPWTATCSDAGIALPSDPPVHPRYYGAFPRKIRRYALEEKVISLEEAVRVSTSLPAQILNLPDRGVIKPGNVADLVVFDPNQIRDLADAFTPHRFAEGIPFVLVNGHFTVEDGRPTGNLPGKVLRKNASE